MISEERLNAMRAESLRKEILEEMEDLKILVTLLMEFDDRLIRSQKKWEKRKIKTKGAA